MLIFIFLPFKNGVSLIFRTSRNVCR